MTAKILVVEDREMISKAISDMLTLNGYTVCALAENGKEALDAYKKRSPDIVLLDLLLPDMSGLEVAQEMITLNKDVSIVAITALTKKDLQEECTKVGIDHIVRKPFRMKELLSTIEEVLRSK